MGSLSKKVLCQEICKKIGITRKNHNRETLDKRELLHVNSACDLLPKRENKEEN